MEALFSLERSHFPRWANKFALLLLYILLGLDDLVGGIFRLLTCRNHFDTRLSHFSLQRNSFVGRRNDLFIHLFRFLHGLDDFAEWNFHFPTWKNDSDTGLAHSDMAQNRYFTRRNGVNTVRNVSFSEIA
jgi:hypothetical protein